MGEQMVRVSHIVNYSTIKRNEVFATSWMNYENIMRCESQAKKISYDSIYVKCLE